VTRSRCDHPTHCSKTTKSLTSDNRPSTSDNSKSPQDAAIRYEPAAAVNTLLKNETVKRQDNYDTNNLTRLQTSLAPAHYDNDHSTIQHHKTEASPRRTAATLKITTFEFPACQ
jgi:hypothetical protein